VLGRHRKAGVKGEVEVGEVKRGEVAVGSETKPTQNLELPAALMVLDSFLCWSANSVTVGAPCLCFPRKLVLLLFFSSYEEPLENMTQYKLPPQMYSSLRKMPTC